MLSNLFFFIFEFIRCLRMKFVNAFLCNPFNFFSLFLFICRNLREMFKIDAADYMMSICGNDALRELSSPGKSGSIFFLSQDDRFMIKTLRKSEVKVFFSSIIWLF